MQSGGVSIPVTLALALTALVYTRGWYQLRKTLSHPVPGWRCAVFVAGLLSVWIAIGSPLAELDHEMLSIHMVQHLLLMAVGAPLILLGAPIPLLPFFRCSPIRTIGNRLTHPAVGWLAGTAAVIGWHIPAAFELGMRAHLWHVTQQATFFAAGILFWWPAIEQPGTAKKPRWFVPLYLFLGTLPCDALSAFLTFCDRVVYESYVRRSSLLDISPLRDQETAGALMWVCVTFIYLLPAVVITIKLLSAPMDQAAMSKVGP
jgi:putative membrane protein